ncbi:hypothetical protein [Streptomyces sp. SAS_260]
MLRSRMSEAGTTGFAVFFGSGFCVTADWVGGGAAAGEGLGATLLTPAS